MDQGHLSSEAARRAFRSSGLCPKGSKYQYGTYIDPNVEKVPPLRSR